MTAISKSRPPIRVLVVFGTRPEAVKLCVLICHLAAFPDKFHVRTVVTGQHRSMLDQVLHVFDVKPDHDLNLMTPGQTLYETTSRILSSLSPILNAESPELVLVQGDTTTTFAAALAAFYAQIPVGHIEAGLRTGNPYSPYPEEINRLLTTRLSTLHFAATAKSAANLTREGVHADGIWVTGNTVIDAALYIRDALASGRIPRPVGPDLNPSKKMILVTAHRRESFGPGLESICNALALLAKRCDVEIVFPVHRNPRVLEPAHRILDGRPNIHLVEPMDYTPFIDLLSRSYMVLTDSGGIQEEAPSMGKPVLVLRENTERPEAVEAGSATLVGTDPERILAATYRLLDDPVRYRQMACKRNPFGDGKACQRIAAVVEEYAERRHALKQRVASA